MRWPRIRGAAGWMAAGVCVSVGILTWFGYRAIREWQRSSTLLVERHADEAADLLVTALTRDMRAVQKSVLTSPESGVFTLDPPYDLINVAASAFARYPYPEAFFAAQDLSTPSSLVFFTRSDRPPAWVESETAGNRFPVTVHSDAAIGSALAARLASDASHGRRFSTFQMPLGGVVYQVIARLMFQDPFRERVDGVFGFIVNMPWVRGHYFPELTNQVARMGGAASGLALAIVDDRGVPVASTESAAVAGPMSRRSFPVVFFDPLLVTPEPATDMPTEQWTVRVSAAADPTLAAAIQGADRTLMIAALAAASLAIGFVLSARAVRASANLAELRSDFVATVTHELKTPIAAIRAMGDTLVSGRVSNADTQREYAQMVVQESKRLTRLVDNLLALSRITDVADAYSFEPVAIDGVIDEALQEYRHLLAAGGFDTEVDVAPDVPLVRGDRTALSLMLDNLIDNAIRYSVETRFIRIAASADGAGMVALTVADAGRGISDDEIDLVTRKFVRGRQATSGGSGLGLAIVKRIARDHGGDLTIRSQLNVGTTVTVRIPIHQDDEEAHPRR